MDGWMDGWMRSHVWDSHELLVSHVALGDDPPK